MSRPKPPTQTIEPNCPVFVHRVPSTRQARARATFPLILLLHSFYMFWLVNSLIQNKIQKYPTIPTTLKTKRHYFEKVLSKDAEYESV